jgi:hypothetical protein
MALVERVKNTLLSPHSELQVIDAEPATVASLYSGYIAPLAAIPAICSAIGTSLFGVSIPIVGGHYHMPIGTVIVNAVVYYVMTLIFVYVGAFIINALAPTFSGTKNMVQALKVVAVSATPGWVAGILGLVPALRIIALLAMLYGLYLLYLSLPVMMKSPVEKAAGYTVVVVVCCVIVGLIIGAVVAALGFAGMGMSGYRP